MGQRSERQPDAELLAQHLKASSQVVRTPIVEGPPFSILRNRKG